MSLDLPDRLRVGVANLLASAGLPSSATAVALRNSHVWPGNESAHDASEGLVALGLMRPSDHEPREWSEYAAIWCAPDQAADTWVAMADNVCAAVRRRFYALVMRRDDVTVMRLIDLALEDVLRWSRDGDPARVSYCVEGIKVELPREIDDALEIADDEREFCVWLWNDEFGAESFLTHRVESPSSEAHARERIEAAIDLLRVAFVAPVRPTRVISYREGLTAIRTGDDVRQEFVSERGGCWLASRVFKVGDTRKVVGLWEPWLRNRKQLEAPVRAFTNAVLAPSKYETVAWSVAAMESLLAPNARNDGVRDILVANRAERILEQHPSRRVWVRNLIGQCRGKVRNPTFHADSYKHLEDGLKRVSNEVARTESEVAEEMVSKTSILLLAAVGALAAGATVESFLTGVYIPPP